MISPVRRRIYMVGGREGARANGGGAQTRAIVRRNLGDGDNSEIKKKSQN